MNTPSSGFPISYRDGYPDVNRGTLHRMAKRLDVTAFGARLRQAREHAQLSRKQVSEKLRLGYSTVHDAETIAIGSKHTSRFGALYKVSAHWLATGEGDMLRAETAQAAPFAVLRLAAVYRALDPDMQAVLLDTARALYRHHRRITQRGGPATTRPPAGKEKHGA
jgi:transcriptional regulator with XRE-family HTH domain